MNIPSDAEIIKRINSAAETPELDYKQDMDLAGSREAKAELTKDIIAMSNGNGGLLIIGVAETATGFDWTGMSQQTLRSFDGARLADFVGNYSKTPIGVVTKKITDAGKTYGVIIVPGLQADIHVVAKDFTPILNNGEVLVRKAGGRSGRADAEELRALMSRISNVQSVQVKTPDWPGLPSVLQNYPKGQDALRIIRAIPLDGLAPAPLTKLRPALLQSAIRAQERRTLLLFPRMEEDDQPAHQDQKGITFADQTSRLRVGWLGTDGRLLVGEEIAEYLRDANDVQPVVLLQTELLTIYIAVVFVSHYGQTLGRSGYSKTRYELASRVPRGLVEMRVYMPSYVWRRTDSGGYPIVVERDVPLDAEVNDLKSMSCDMVLELCSYFGANYTVERLQKMLDESITASKLAMPSGMT